MPDFIIDIDHISKQFESKIAVSEVSFQVPKGSIFGILGPNGAGKTTTIRMINQITIPDSGQILINKEKLQSKHTGLIGYMPEERGLYPQMPVGDQLVYFGQLKGLSHKEARAKVQFWLEKFDIQSWSKKKVYQLSKGMQQKVQFIVTVLHEPQIIILDEPLSGLDPINSKLINDEIMRLREAGATILFSTHRMEQVEEICDQIVLFNQGQIILDGEVKAIKNQFKQNLFKVDYTSKAPTTILQSNFALKEIQPNYLTFQLNQGQNSTQLIKYLVDNGLQITSFNEILPTLNEIFIIQVNKSDQATYTNKHFVQL